ncbi:MAG: TolC family protein, partial [Armatimonadota bacterium]
MRSSLWSGSLWLLLCLAVGLAQAQSLTVAEAVQIAVESHPSLQVARFELEAAEAQLRGARARVTPEVRITPGLIGSA